MSSSQPSPASSPLPSGYWQHLTTTDFARVDPARTIALLPVAAIEQHGPHLPLATDAIINEGVVAETLRRLPASSSVLVLPAMNVGDSLEHTAFPGTLSADMDTLVSLWLSIGHAVSATGIRKLVIFNSHGGQKAHVDLAALRLRVALGMLVLRAHSFSFGVPAGSFEADELAHGLHGGAVETSLVMHLKPELVRTDELANFASTGIAMAARGGLIGVEKPVGIGWMTQDLNPSGACGNAALATPEKGAALLDHLASRMVALLAEVEAMPAPHKA
ncbi:creatininase family protein [soil metagenome]